MRKLLLILGLIIAFGCSKSTSDTDKTDYKYNGTWEVVSYTKYDATGDATKEDWVYKTLILNNESAKATKDNNNWAGSAKYWTNKTSDSILVKINGQPDLTGDIEKWGDGIKINRKESGFLKESWNLTKQ